MNKTTALEIVLSINGDANTALVNELLEESKAKTQSGVTAYRPYIVGARSLSLNPPNQNLKKADTLEWFDWTLRYDHAVSLQAMADTALVDIPPGWSSDPPSFSAIVSGSGLL